MDDNARMVLVRLIEAFKELGKPIVAAAMAGTVMHNLEGIMAMLKEALKLFGGG